MTDPRILRIQQEAEAKARDIRQKNGDVSKYNISEILEEVKNNLEEIGIDYSLIIKIQDDMETHLWKSAKRDNAREIKNKHIKQKNSIQKNNKEKDDRYIVKNEAFLARSPFRFVALNERVATPEISDLTLDLPVKGGFSGCLHVTWAVETPLLIGNEVTEVGKTVVVPLLLATEDGDGYVIPGASLRGMIRAAIEIIAHGRLTQLDNTQYTKKIPKRRGDRGAPREENHIYTVHKMRNKSHKIDSLQHSAPDIPEYLFGYVDEPEKDRSKQNDQPSPRDIARRGRVYFGVAYLQPGMPAEIWPESSGPGKKPPIETVQGAPRASFAPFYLSGTIKDYSSPQSKLAGRKRYIPQTPIDQKANIKNSLGKRLKNEKEKQENISKEVISHLRFLVPKTDGEDLIFTSEIRLHNVTAVEVGALLWVLTHGGDPDKPYRHMIGRAKPFGAGQLRVKAFALKLDGHDADAEKMLTAPEPWELPSGGHEGWTGEGGQSMAPFLTAFDGHMKTRLGEELEANAVVREFLAASDPTIGAALAGAGRMDYPALTDFNALRKISKLSTGKDGGPTWPERFLGMDLAVDKMVMDKQTLEPRPICLPYKETAKP